MRPLKTKIVTALSFLFIAGFSMPAHAETTVTQEELGRAIQQSAVQKQQHSIGVGAAQERLGKAIQDAAQSSNQITGNLQEQLGQQIQDAALLQYAEGRTQERMAETLLQMARS